MGKKQTFIITAPQVLRILLAVMLLCSASGVQAGTKTNKAFARYWNEVQTQRNDYESRVSQIQQQYPDFDSNPKAQQALQGAARDFKEARTKIANSSAHKKVSGDAAVEKRFWKAKQKEYQTDHKRAKTRLDAQLKSIRDKYPNAADNGLAQLEIQNVTNQYYERSRNLAAGHQKDVQDMIRDELTKKSQSGMSKTSAPIKDTAGSGYYQKDKKTGAIKRDKEGNPLINPKHRGHSGDTDVEAGTRTADAKTIKAILTDKGLGDVSVDDKAGYVSIGEGKDGINLTINKSGENFGKVGSSAHQTRVQVDAESKETYVHIGMKKDQPGRSYVAVQDHKKKALKGLGADPGSLLDGDPKHTEALQGMAKGTLKSMQEAQLSNEQLRKIIKDNGLRESPQTLRSKLAKLKEGQAIAPDGVGLHKGNIGKYQQASRDIIEAAEKKTQTAKNQEMNEANAEIKRLTASKNPEDRRRAAELRKRVVDSRVRIKSTQEANSKKAQQIAAKGDDEPSGSGGKKKSTQATKGTKATVADTGEDARIKTKGGSKGKVGSVDSDSKTTTKKPKGVTKSAHGSRSESGIITKTVEDRSGRTTVSRDGTETTKERITVTEKGLTGSSTTDSKTTTKTTPGGHKVSATTTTSEQQGPLGSESSTSTTKTVQTAGGTQKKTTTSTSEQQGLATTTSKTGKTTTTKTRDGYSTTTGQETTTTKVGGKTVVTQETETTGKGRTNKSGSAAAEGTYTKTTTKIGGKTVGQTHTAKGGVTGTFAEDDGSPKKQPSKVSIKIADTMKVDEKGTTQSAGGGATKLGEHGEVSGGYKVETGHTKHQHGTTITIDPSGTVKIEHVNEFEANVVKVTAGGKIEGKAGGVGVVIETKGEFTAGGRAGYKANVEVGPDGIKSTGEVDIFIGMKAEGEISGTLDLKEHIYISIKGTLKGEVSAGAGVKAGYEAELSWTKITISAQAAASLGLGAGGQGTVEVDISVLTTGVDLAKVGEQEKVNDITAKIIKVVKTGQMKLPPGKTWKDIIPDMQKKAEWLAKHPEVLGKDKKAFEEIMKSLEFEKGKGKQKFISIKKQQKDWYCTNRPNISSPTPMSEMINQEITRKNKIRKAFGMKPIELLDN